MINTYNLFAVQLTQAKLFLPPVLHKKILSFIDKNYTEKDLVSCKKGFQFHKDFEGKKEMNELLNKFLLKTFNCYILSSWLNILGDYSYNTPHFHTGNSIALSGVFYLSNQNNNIHFTQNGQVFSLEPKLFDILIFPYNLVHYVLPEERKDKRICHAFNLIDVNNLKNE
jgi:hypothetical protein